jgi:hypothetical protein
VRLVCLFRRAFAAIGFRRRAPAPAAIAGTRGRSLLNDPMFRALARMYEERITPPARATVRDVTEGQWYALMLVPGAERIAIDRVADEVRVPLYLPMRRDIRADWRGRRFVVRRALFTGYGFVQLADVNKLFGRIIACDGVRGIMCESGEPAVIRAGFDDCRKGQYLSPLRFDHELIDFIRVVENGASDWLTDPATTWAAPSPRRRKRRRRKSRRARNKAKASPAPIAEAAA